MSPTDIGVYSPLGLQHAGINSILTFFVNYITFFALCAVN